MSHQHKSKLLLVEGVQDEYFFTEFIQFLNLKNIQIKSYGGKPNLTLVLEAYSDSSTINLIDSIAITCDADIKVGLEAFVEIQEIIRATEFSVPVSLACFSEIQNDKFKQKMGVFVLPSKTQTGELEDLLLEIVKDDPKMSCVNNFFDCLEQASSNPKYAHLKNKPEKKPQKARLYAWCSTYKLEYKMALQEKLFDFTHPSLTDLKNFIITFSKL